MTPFEQSMGAAISAALTVSVAEAEAYARDQRDAFEGARSVLSGQTFAVLEMAVESAEAFAAFRRAIGNMEATAQGILG